MSKHRTPHGAWQVLADVLMCILMWMTMMTSLLLVRALAQNVSDQDFHPKAEYLLTLTWDDKRNVDLDLWVQDPQGHAIYYGNREATNISLDRDSRGFITNKTTLKDGREIYSGNQEIITIRAIYTGTYIVAVDYYDGFNEENHEYDAGDSHAQIDALVTLDKVNPKMTRIIGQHIHLKQRDDNSNVFAFRIEPDGSVTILSTPHQSFIKGHRMEAPRSP